jgi:hypothetical protein
MILRVDLTPNTVTQISRYIVFTSYNCSIKFGGFLSETENCMHTSNYETGASKLLMRTENSRQKGTLYFGPLRIFSRTRKGNKKDGISAWLIQSSLMSYETDLCEMFKSGDNAPRMDLD